MKLIESLIIFNNLLSFDSFRLSNKNFKYSTKESNLGINLLNPTKFANLFSNDFFPPSCLSSSSSLSYDSLCLPFIID